MKINGQQLEETVKKISEKTFSKDKYMPDEALKRIQCTRTWSRIRHIL